MAEALQQRLSKELEEGSSAQHPELSSKGKKSKKKKGSQEEQQQQGEQLGIAGGAADEGAGEASLGVQLFKRVPKGAPLQLQRPATVAAAGAAAPEGGGGKAKRKRQQENGHAEVSWCGGAGCCWLISTPGSLLVGSGSERGMLWLPDS